MSFNGVHGGYVHSMYLNDDAPIAGGREIWGFPKKLAEPSLASVKDALVGTLDYGGQRVATATMGFKHRTLDNAKVLETLKQPNFMLKIIPHVDCTPRICELVRYYLEDLTVKGAWEGPGALGAVSACAGAGCRPAGARSQVRRPYSLRPDAGPRRSGPRLSCKIGS